MRDLTCQMPNLHICLYGHRWGTILMYKICFESVRLTAIEEATRPKSSPFETGALVNPEASIVCL